MSTEERADPDQSARRHRRRWVLLGSVAAAGFVADLITKIIATATLDPADPVKLLGGAVYFQLVRNPNAAFGLGAGMTPLLTVFAILVVGAIIWFSRKVRSTGWGVGLGLVLAGALGNLADRIFRAPGPFQGHVIDFISVFAPNGEVWPVFNVADSCITVGAVLIVVLSLLGKDYDGTSARERKELAAQQAQQEKQQPAAGDDGGGQAHRE